MTTTTTVPRVDVERFERDGYLVIRGVFSREEVLDIRERALRSREHRGDILSSPLLRDVLLEGRILGIAEQLLGGTPVYFGDASLALTGSRGLHKDNTDRRDKDAPDWWSPYTNIRFGLYLQDHAQHSGGLTVRRGSHRTPSLLRGRVRNLRTELGDLVVWNHRTSHSGDAVLLKFPRWLDLPPRLAQFVPERMRVPTNDGDRLAIFVTVGLRNAHMDRWIEGAKRRTYMKELWENSVYDDETRRLAAEANMIHWDVWPELRDDPSVGTDEVWAPLPY